GILNPTTVGPHTVSWLTPGNKTVSLSISSPGCPLATVTQVITVNQHTNSFVVSNNPICTNTNTNLTFTGVSSTSTSFNWNCGGCLGLTQVNNSGPHTVSWSSEGTKTVTLTLTTAGCGSATVTVLVTVNQHNAAFSIGANPHCLNNSTALTFSGTAVSTTSYNWNCDGCLGITNNTVAGPHNVSWATVGNKTVSLALNTPGCSPSVATQVITINQQQVSFTVSETQLCTGSTTQLTFSGIVSTGSIFNWACDGCSGLTAPSSSGPHTVSWTSAGIKSITLQVATPGCGVQTVTHVVTVYAPPTSNFSVSSNQGCTGAAVVLTHLGPPAVNYTWNCDGCVGASLSTAGPHTVSWNTIGVKTLTLQVSSPACAAPNPTTVLVTINQHQASFTVQNNPVCVGQNTSLTFNGLVTGTLTTYNWNCDGCSNLTNPTNQGPHSIFWNVAGIRTVTLTLSTPGCSPSTATVLITVNAQPSSTFSASSSAICVGNDVTLTFNGTPGVNYAWNCDGCNQTPTTAGPHVVSWSSAGTKTLTLLVSSPGCAPSGITTTIVTVYAQPTSVFTVSPSPTCVGAPTTITHQGVAGLTFTWNCDGCNATLTTAGPHQVSWNTPGTKTLSLVVASQGCPISTPTNVIVIVNQQQANATASQNPVCLNQNSTLSFAGTASNGTVYNWSCNGCTGIVSTSTVGPHTVSWSTPGTKTVTLSISTPGCTPEIATVLVTVNAPPTANFNISATTICEGATTQLAFTGVPGSSYNWTCDGCIGIANTVGPHVVSWTTSGTKTVSLVVSVPGCSPSTTVTALVTVNQPPTADFDISNNPICVQTNTQLAFVGVPGSSYLWNCNGCSGINVTSVGPHTVSWATAGIKTVSLRVTTPGCPQVTQTVLVTVNNAPTSTFFASNSVTCVNTPIVVSFAGVAGTTYTWNCGGCSGVIPGTEGPHSLSWSNPGLKTISLTVASPGCSPSAVTTVTVQVNATPTAHFTLSHSLICVNTSVVATFTGVAGNSYNWNCNGCLSGNPATIGPHSLSWNTPGVKTITLTVDQVGCVSATATQVVSVNPVPTALISASHSTTCVESNVDLSSVGSVGDVFSWSCDGCNGLVPSSAGPQRISWLTPGTKTVTLTVSNSGCSTPVTQNITLVVTPIPNPTFVISTSPICINQNTTLTFTGSGATTFNWNCDGCQGLVPNIVGPHSVSWSAPGIKTVNLTVSAVGCPPSTFTQTVIVNAPPVVSFDPSINPTCINTPTVLGFSGSAAPGAIYTWSCDGCGQSLAGPGPHSVSWSSIGVRTVSLTVQNLGCAQTATATQLITVNQQPVAAFTINPTTLCAGATAVVTFTGTPGQVYNWNCDGCTETPTSIGPHNLVWLTTGTKTISLNVTTPGCPLSNTATQVITINLNTSTFQVSKTNACVNEVVTLTFTGTPGNTYTWNCDGCSANPTTVGPHRIHWNTEGIKTLTLQVSSSGCVSDVTTVLVTINPIPTSTFNFATSVCVGEYATAEFTGTPGNDPTTYSWSCDGCDEGIAQTVGPHNIKWSTSGTKTLRLRVISNGCSSNIHTHTVTVHPRPVANFSASGPVCIGALSNLIFTGSLGTSPSVFTWNCDNCEQGLLSGQGPHQVSWSTAGIKTIMLQLASSGCSAVTPASVLVTVLPTPTSNFTANPLAICSRSSSSNIFTELTYTGVFQNTPVFTWNCDNCEGGISNTIGPHRVSWSTPGIKTVTLRVSNTGENTCTSLPTTLLVTVNPTPTSVFSASSVDICAGSFTTLTFGGQAQNGAQYFWNCDGCVAPALAGPGPHTVSWNTPGIKTITLKIENPAPTHCSSAITSVLVNVRPSPAAPNPRSNSPACASGVLTLTADLTPGAIYEWRGPGGWTSARATPTRSGLTPSAAGVYTVTVSLGSCSVTATTNVVVNSAPVAPNPTSNSPVCENGLLSLSATASPNAEYEWSGPAGFSSSLQNPSITGTELTTANSGIYTVTVKVPGCAPRSGFVTVRVNSAPLPPNLPSTLQLCSGNTLNINPTGTLGATYAWSGPSGFTSSELVLVRNNITTSMAGTYVLTVSVPGCPDEVGVTTVGIDESPNLPRLQHNGPICEGQELRFTTVPTAGASYLWLGPNNFTANTSSISIPNATTAASGFYSFQVTLGNCTLSDTATVIVSKAPETPVITTSTLPICAGSTLSLTASTIPGITYTWKAPDEWTFTFRNTTNQRTNIPVQREDIPISASGIYTLVASSAGCPSTSVTVNVTVNPRPDTPNIMPVAPICSGNPIRLAIRNPIPGITYSWRGPAGFSSSLVNPTINNATVNQAGTYSVSAILQGCTAQSTVAVVVNEPAPVPSINSNGPVCVGATLQFTLSNPVNYATYEWQGPAFSAPTSELNPVIPQVSLSTSGIYTLVVRVPGCAEQRSTLTVVVNRLPGIPTTLNLERCSGQAFVFTATMGLPIGNEIRLYDSAQQTIITSDNTPPSYTLNVGNITTTTTFFISAFNSTTGCESEKRQVIARVNEIPPAPRAFEAVRCNPGIVTFMPEVPGEPSGVGVRIYDEQGALITSDIEVPYELPVYIATTTTFYLESFFVASGCESNSRTAVVASLREQPLPPTNLSTRRCGPGSVTINVSSGIPAGAEVMLFAD
ncbi:MAG: hypothetical protein NZ576_11385, partial [Bacteroidia bacterium]|nr:hypothetical protein [Bacteroidia bacterium]